MHPARFLRALPLLATAACATAGRERVYIAPTDSTVLTSLEAALTGRGQHVTVQNNSTVGIVVTSISLRDCENIKNRCEVTRMRVPVRAGEKRRIVTVETQNDNLSSNFRYGYTWEPEPNAAPVIP